MKYFGCRASFAIEVGDACDQSDHTRLDFYTHDIHLNRIDNRGYVGACLRAWPSWSSDENQAGTNIYRELPFSTKPDALLSYIMIDGDLWQSHATFRLGPVTDSFDMLVFNRPSDFVLIFIRTDGWGGDDLSDIGAWNVSNQLGWWHRDMKLGSPPVLHWLSVTIPKQKFIHICSSAYDALAASQSHKSHA